MMTNLTDTRPIERVIRYRRVEIPLVTLMTRRIAAEIRRMDAENAGRLVKIVIFVPAAPSRRGGDSPNIQRKLVRLLQETLPDRHIPALTVVEQPPVKSRTVAMDIFYTDSPAIKVHYDLFEGLPYVTLLGYGCRQFWSSGFATPYAAMRGKKLSPPYAAGLHCLNALQRWIDRVGLSCDHIIRQWNYIGRILDFSLHGATGEMRQNYQEFNAVREKFYQQYKNDTLYPAATGIGCDYAGIIVDAVLFETADGHRPPALKSPVQAEAFDYTERVLVGKAAKTPPLFSRARLQTIRRQPAANLPLLCWISGTASIAGEATIDPESPEKQLDNTIQSIASLVATSEYPVPVYDRVRLYLKPTLSEGQVARLVKNLHAHYPPEICQVVYADVCRDNLWVEIEAESAPAPEVTDAS